MQKKDKIAEEKETNLTQKLEEYKNKYLRALADYQNLEKRMAQQMGQMRRRANRSLLIQFLDILDNIEAAELFLKDEGLKLVKEKFIAVLRNEGVEEIDVLGKEYDPYLAECTEVVTGNKDNIVSAVVQKGYKQQEEVLRPAKVKVAQVK